METYRKTVRAREKFRARRALPAMTIWASITRERIALHASTESESSVKAGTLLNHTDPCTIPVQNTITGSVKVFELVHDIFLSSRNPDNNPHGPWCYIHYGQQKTGSCSDIPSCDGS